MTKNRFSPWNQIKFLIYRELSFIKIALLNVSEKRKFSSHLQRFTKEARKKILLGFNEAIIVKHSKIASKNIFISFVVERTRLKRSTIKKPRSLVTKPIQPLKAPQNVQLLQKK